MAVNLFHFNGCSLWEKSRWFNFTLPLATLLCKQRIQSASFDSTLPFFQQVLHLCVYLLKKIFKPEPAKVWGICSWGNRLRLDAPFRHHLVHAEDFFNIIAPSGVLRPQLSVNSWKCKHILTNTKKIPLSMAGAPSFCPDSGMWHSSQRPPSQSTMQFGIKTTLHSCSLDPTSLGMRRKL